MTREQKMDSAWISHAACVNPYICVDLEHGAEHKKQITRARCVDIYLHETQVLGDRSSGCGNVSPQYLRARAPRNETR